MATVITISNEGHVKVENESFAPESLNLGEAAMLHGPEEAERFDYEVLEDVDEETAVEISLDLLEDYFDRVNPAARYLMSALRSMFEDEKGA